MQAEINKVDTDNIKIEFSNNPNNLQLSDELEADPVYVRKMGTAYSIGKWTKRITVAVGFTITVTAAAVMGGLGKNVFVPDPPKVQDIAHEFSKADNLLTYRFNVTENKRSYSLIFSITIKGEKNPYYTLDCSQIGEYKGEVGDFEVGHLYVYSLVYSNRLDYKNALFKGEIDTYREVHK